MARPHRIEYPDAWYQMMNRGRHGEVISMDDLNYVMFTELLKETSEMWNVRIAAGSVMKRMKKGCRGIASLYGERVDKIAESINSNSSKKRT